MSEVQLDEPINTIEWRRLFVMHVSDLVHGNYYMASLYHVTSDYTRYGLVYSKIHNSVSLDRELIRAIRNSHLDVRQYSIEHTRALLRGMGYPMQVDSVVLPAQDLLRLEDFL